MAFVVRNESRSVLPTVAWRAIKNKIVSRRYDLGLVFTSSKRMMELNRRYRGKTGPTNVLAFGLDKNEGEIFMGLGIAKREAAERGTPYSAYVLFLYIHALLHLKGFDHDTRRASVRMDREEKKWLNALQ